MKAAQITVRMTDHELSKLEELAARQSVQVSELVRAALAKQVAVNVEPSSLLRRIFRPWSRS